MRRFPKVPHLCSYKVSFPQPWVSSPRSLSFPTVSLLLLSLLSLATLLLIALFLFLSGTLQSISHDLCSFCFCHQGGGDGRSSAVPVSSAVEYQLEMCYIILYWICSPL